jgi:hypothetical protein
MGISSFWAYHFWASPSKAIVTVYSFMAIAPFCLSSIILTFYSKDKGTYPPIPMYK